jgi:hypothetical protein
MKIDSTTFGAITIDGTTYQHDVVVRLSGEVVKRKKKLSKKLYGCPCRKPYEVGHLSAPPALLTSEERDRLEAVL